MAKSNRDRKSLRRNPIDDLTDKKKEQSSLDTQNQHLSSINNKLDDNQAASEMVAEAVEYSSNRMAEIIGSHLNESRRTLGDILASSELTTESVNAGLRNLDKTSNIISNKLTSVFKELQKLNDIKSKGAPLEDALKNNMPEVKPEDFVGPPAPNPFPEPEPSPPANSNDGGGKPEELPSNKPKPEKPQPKRDEKKQEKKKSSESEKGTKDVLVQGFKALTQQGDTMSKLLFDMTITSAANAAKTVALVGALIFGMDIIRMNFKYYSKMLETNFKEFEEKFGEVAPILKDILTTTNDVIKAMESGLDGDKLSNAIIKGLKNLFIDTVNTLGLNLSRLVAAIIRKFPGGGDTADYVEGKGISQYQDATGAHLDGRDKELAGKYDLGVEKDLATRREENIASPNELVKNRFYDPNVANPDYMKMDDSKAASIVSDRNNVLSDIQTATDRLNDETDDPKKLVDSMKSYMTQINQEFNSLKTESPDSAKMIQSQLDAVNKLFQDKSNDTKKSSVGPGSPKNNPDVIKERNIVTQTRAIKNTSGSSGDTNNVGVTNIKNVNNQVLNKVVPVTATPAPGMGNHSLRTN